ncbi:MAG: dUTP diphosphatase [Ginsengibacter sp.]
MEETNIKIRNISNNPFPKYATIGSSGLDLMAHVEFPITIESLERKLIPTGLFLEIPQDMEAQVRPRSGLAINHGITCLNSPGTIDSDYRGEIKVILVNLSGKSFTVNNGDRIAQIIFSKVEKIKWQEESLLSTSSRGEGGFGHTGN